MPGPRAARSPSRINKRLTPSGGGGRWAYEHKNEEAIEMLQAAGVNEDAKDRGSRPSRPAPGRDQCHPLGALVALHCELFDA